MKKLKKVFVLLFCCILLIGMVPATVFAAPSYNPFFTPDPGEATPASVSGTTQAVPYIYTERPLAGTGSVLFDATAAEFKAEFTAPVKGEDYGTVTFDNNQVQYTPNANAAGKRVQFIVYAADSSGDWTSEGIEFTVTVNEQPAEGSNNANLSALYYQVGEGEPMPVPGFSASVSEYTVMLPEGTVVKTAVTLSGTLEDDKASVVYTSTTADWAYYSKNATATVTAENGVTKKEYVVHFQIQPPDSQPAVYTEDCVYSDGDTIAVGTNESRTLYVLLGSGNTGAGSCSVVSSDWNALPINTSFDAIYPLVMQQFTLKLEPQDSADLTISFFSDTKTTNLMETIILHIVSHDHTWGSTWSSDEKYHWNSCTDENCPEPSSRGNLAEHSGGTATCSQLAVCDICGEEYGEVNAANHTNLVKTEAKAATHMTEGNIEYWYCDGCDKYYSDEAGAKEITLADTVVPKMAEHTADGTGWHSDEMSHWNTCECGGTLNEAAHTFEWVIDKEATATEKGSKHERCTVCGYEKAAVEISATETATDTDNPTGTDTSKTSPQTGANETAALGMAVLLAVCTALTGTVLYSRKKKYNR